MTDLAQPKLVANAAVPLEDARNVYVARTYAYVSAGKQGLAIVDVENRMLQSSIKFSTPKASSTT